MAGHLIMNKAEIWVFSRLVKCMLVNFPRFHEGKYLEFVRFARPGNAGQEMFSSILIGPADGFTHLDNDLVRAQLEFVF